MDISFPVMYFFPCDVEGTRDSGAQTSSSSIKDDSNKMFAILDFKGGALVSLESQTACRSMNLTQSVLSRDRATRLCREQRVYNFFLWDNVHSCQPYNFDIDK